MAKGRRVLIVNADDLGQSEGINRGIAEAHERGVVTSASLLVRWPGAAAAATYVRSRPDLSVGLHLDLGEWYPQGGSSQARYELLATKDPGQVAAELRRQLERFRELMSEDPTHLDSHHHVHLADPTKQATLELAAELAVPVRHFTPGLMYRGEFFGQDQDGNPNPRGIELEALVALVRSLPPGLTELGCHPGYADERMTSYAAPRAEEIRVLCDPRLRSVIEDERIELRSFRTARSPGESHPIPEREQP